jgi:hypothetical protein
MPLIDEVLIYKNDYFVETGSYKGDAIEIALNNGFKNVYSIELSQVFYYDCIKRFIRNPNVKLFQGNSRYDLHKLISNINSPITFWLDGHWSGTPNVGCDKDVLCPIIYELDQIDNHHLKTHTIMIDDMRLMNGTDFEVTKDEICKKIMEINPNYIFKYYDTQYSREDILVAFINPELISNKKTHIVRRNKCIHRYLTEHKTLYIYPGFGDFIRGTITLFEYSKKYDFDFYIDDSHPIFKYFKKNNKIIKTDIKDKDTLELLPNMYYNIIDINLQNLFIKNKSFNILTNAFYTRDENGEVINFGEISNDCKLFLKDILTPNEELNNKINNVYDILGIDINKGYNVIHLRLGDSCLIYNEYNENILNIMSEKIRSLLEQDENQNKQFILITDSESMGDQLKIKNPSLFYWNNQKIHFGHLKNNELSVENTLADFFIMSKSNAMFCYAFNGVSGFSKFISLIYDISYIMI